jgi:hypothetical protein
LREIRPEPIAPGGDSHGKSPEDEVIGMDEYKVQKLSKQIWSNITGEPLKEVDDSFLEDIECHTSKETTYTPEDYKKIMFNTLELFRDYAKLLRIEINQRDKIINYLYKAIKDFHKKKLSIPKVSESEYEDGLDIIEIAMKMR